MTYCLFINGFWQPPNLLWQIEQYKQEFKSHGAELKVFSTADLHAVLSCGKVVSDIGDFDGVLYLDKDVAIARMLELSGYKLYNSATAIEVCDDKVKTYLALSGKGIAIPDTISSPLLYAGQDKEDFCDRIIDRLSLPIVVKENYGSFGKQVYLARNIVELKQLRAQLLYKPHLYQKFIACSSGRDTRVIVIGGKAFCAMSRSNVADFRSNIELGGVGAHVNLPEEYIATAERVASILGLDYCGIDLLCNDDGSPIVCEVNSNAYFNTISKICNVNVAKAYVEHIIGEKS